ncbi:hypothetical protein [Pseudomonas nitroreducens]|uniref:hypothetical protein n=1 Tax=Pseudomonas nitroreducens TaxID=46680 RepID=UPI001FB5987A|nr:hypothetical protein [Pseudomonas nitroreducens]MCJ1879660.1 hypothetical protein [Pseudomonas nitroreducens]MCJ1896821.1 hypothetical protein [Pseudomonas nitroreducens]
MPSTKQAQTSFPILGLLGLLFIGLKLTNRIDWSWWWVTAPFWAIPGIPLLIAAVAGLGYLIVWVMERKGS